MRRRGQGLVAIVLVGLAVAGAIVAVRLGAAPAPTGPVPSARSGEWLCPHGGGKGWTAQVVLANPGAATVQVRITSLADDAKPTTPLTVDIPAGATLARDVPATSTTSATYVEVFGGWVAASWLVRGAEPAIGLGAEACASAGGDRWVTTESTTQEGETASLIVMNPYASGAVFDVTLYQPDEPPLRDPDWASLELRPGRSLALRLDQKVAGKDAVAAVVEVRSGRVGVATLGATEGGGVRSVLGVPAASSSWSVGTQWGTGQSSLVIFVPGEDAVRFGATLRSQRPPQVAGGLVDVRQSSLSTQAYPVSTDGPSVIEVRSVDDATVVVALRSQGESDDDAATTGLVAPATAWVVGPTVAGSPSYAGTIVVNPTDAPAEVTLQALGKEGPEDPLVLTLPAGGTARIGEGFRNADPTAAVLVTASSPVVAFGASTSAGTFGLSLYAVLGGVPIPDWVLAG